MLASATVTAITTHQPILVNSPRVWVPFNTLDECRFCRRVCSVQLEHNDKGA